MRAAEISLVLLDTAWLYELPTGVVVEDRYGVRWVREDRGDDRWGAVLHPDPPTFPCLTHAGLADRAALFLVVAVPAGWELQRAARPLGEDGGPATGEWELPELVSPSAYDVRRDALLAAVLTHGPELGIAEEDAIARTLTAEVYERHLTRPDDSGLLQVEGPGLDTVFATREEWAAFKAYTDGTTTKTTTTNEES